MTVLIGICAFLKLDSKYAANDSKLSEQNQVLISSKHMIDQQCTTWQLLS